MAPAGEITHFGVVTVGDDAGMVSDLIAGFFEFTEGDSEEFLTWLAVANEARCQLESDDLIDFEEMSAGSISNNNCPGKRSVRVRER